MPTAGTAAAARDRADPRPLVGRAGRRGTPRATRARRPSRRLARRRRDRPASAATSAGTGAWTSGAEVAPLEQLEAARRTHAAAAPGRAPCRRRASLRAQHDAVAACGDDLRREPQLRLALAHPNDAGGVLGRPVVDVDAGAVGDRLELVERDVQPVADGVGARLDERVAAPQAAALEPGERRPRRAARPRRARPDGRAPGRCARAPRRRRARAREHVALADRARPERAGRDGADPAQREDAVDVEPRRLRRRALGDRRPPRRRERRAQLVEPLAGLGADRDDLGAGDELARLLDAPARSVSASTASVFVTRDDAALDPEEPQDREVLVRLRPRALARVDRRAGRGRSRSRRRPWCGRSARGPGTSTSESRRPSGSSSGA